MKHYPNIFRKIRSMGTSKPPRSRPPSKIGKTGLVICKPIGCTVSFFRLTKEITDHDTKCRALQQKGIFHPAFYRQLVSKYVFLHRYRPTCLLAG